MFPRFESCAINVKNFYLQRTAKKVSYMGKLWHEHLMLENEISMHENEIFAPKYIKELLVPYKPRRHLRSEAKGLLNEPRTRLKFGDRAFSISAPRLWNTLPQHLKDSTSCQAFKKCLKTHLFRLAHWGVLDYDSNYDNVQRFWTVYEWKWRYINSNYYLLLDIHVWKRNFHAWKWNFDA